MEAESLMNKLRELLLDVLAESAICLEPEDENTYEVGASRMEALARLAGFQTLAEAYKAAMAKSAAKPDLSGDEFQLLERLVLDRPQFSECHGNALSALRAMGLVAWNDQDGEAAQITVTWPGRLRVMYP